MSAPSWMTALPDEAGFLAVLCPCLILAHVVGNRVVEGGSRRATGKMLVGSGVLIAGAALAWGAACDGDKRGLCSMIRSPQELLSP